MRADKKPVSEEIVVTTLERLRQTFPGFGIGALAERMGIELTGAEADGSSLAGTMPVAGNTQPYGLLHGGASVVLAETLGSVGAAIAAGPDRVALGVDINATHHRAVRQGHVTGVATPLQVGRTTACFEVVISDESGRRVCTSRITCQLRNAPQGTLSAGG